MVLQMESNEFIEGFAKEADIILSALGFQRKNRGRASWSNLVYIYKMNNSEDYIFIRFRYISSGEVETGMSYYNKNIYNIFDRCNMKLTGFQRWIFSVNYLSFPEWSGVWGKKIKDYNDPQAFAREMLCNAEKAFLIFFELCSDLNLSLTEIGNDTAIGRQLSLMIDHRIKIAICIAIALDKQDLIHKAIISYSKQYMNTPNFDFIASQCISFIQCQVNCGNLDDGVSQKCISELKNYI